MHQPRDAIDDGRGHLALAALHLAIVISVERLQIAHLLLPVLKRALQRRLRQHLALLLKVFLLAQQLVLASVQLPLPAIEVLTQRSLGAEAVFGLHDRATHIDDSDLHRT